MDNAKAAEWILSLFTTPDRAAATVGDLIESRVGTLRFWSAIGSQILRRTAMPALVAFLAQYFLVFWAGFGLMFITSFTLFRWVADLTLLASQLLAGYGIARYGKTRAFGVCVIVVLTDGVLGALRINNANINMAVWAIPLLASTLIAHQAGSRTAADKAPVRGA